MKRLRFSDFQKFVWVILQTERTGQRWGNFPAT